MGTLGQFLDRVRKEDAYDRGDRDYKRDESGRFCGAGNTHFGAKCQRSEGHGGMHEGPKSKAKFDEEAAGQAKRNAIHRRATGDKGHTCYTCGKPSRSVQWTDAHERASRVPEGHPAHPNFKGPHLQGIPHDTD